MACAVHSCRVTSLAGGREKARQGGVRCVPAHRGTVYLSLREHYEKDAKMLPGGAGQGGVGWAEGQEQAEVGAVYELCAK